MGVKTGAIASLYDGPAKSVVVIQAEDNTTDITQTDNGVRVGWCNAQGQFNEIADNMPF